MNNIIIYIGLVSPWLLILCYSIHSLNEIMKGGAE